MAAPGRKKGPRPQQQSRKPAPAPERRAPGTTATAPTPVAGPRNALGLIGVILGALSVPGALVITFGVVLGIPAAVLGFLSLKRVRRGEATNFRSSVGAMALGLVGVAIAISLIVYGQHVLNTPAGKRYTACDHAAGKDKAAQKLCRDAFDRERK